jgi:hypothetical protein
MEMDDDQIAQYFHVHTVPSAFGGYAQYPCWLPDCNR